MFKRVYWILDKIRFTAIVGILGYVVLLSFVQIVLRYFTSADLKPFAWGDEIIRLLTIWVVFLAASVGVRQESHLSVEFFLNKFLTPRQMTAAKKIAMAILMIALGAIAFVGTQYTLSNTTNMLQNLPNLTIAWFYAAIPIGCLYLLLEYAILFINGKPIDLKKDREEKL